MEKIIEIQSLTKRFKKLCAVNSLNLNVYKGDVFGFLGPNGAGKSTTIRMLLGLIRPTSGSISLFNMDLRASKDRILKNVGAIVEKPDFYGYLSAYKNLELLGSISGKPVTRTRIFEMLGLVGLSSRHDSKVKTFSHGMKQRLGIAQALLHDPELIILDEPTTGLDPQGMKEIRDLILLLSKEKGKTILLSSHILYEVELVANRMVILNKGTTVIEGEVAALLSATALEVTFKVNDPMRALALLSESRIPVEKTDHFPDGIIVTTAYESIAVATRLFVENGLDVYSVVPKRSLEEYFLKLTENA